MTESTLKIDERFKRTFTARYKGASFQAGILENKPHYAAMPRKKGLTSAFGGPARKQSRKVRGTVADVGERLRKSGADYLRAPFNAPNSGPMRRFRKAFGDFLARKKGVTKKHVEQVLADVIRTPILQGKYGRNSAAWARIKGFNRKFIDTAQFVKAIVGKVTGAR